MMKHIFFNISVSLKHLKTATNKDNVILWKYKDFQKKLLNILIFKVIILKLEISYIDNAKTRVKLNGSFFKARKITFNHNIILKFYITYQI